jgi:internalin A
VISDWCSCVRVVASWVCLMGILASTGCDALQSVNKEKGEETVSTPPPPPPSAPPTVEAPPPRVLTPQEIIDGFLALPNTEKRDEHLAQLAGLTEGLDAIITLDLSRSGVSDEGMKSLAAFPALTELNLSETRVTNAGLASVAEAKSLRKLTLASLRAVDDLGVQNLTSLTDLEELTVAACPVTDTVLPTLAKFDGLQVLKLTGCQDLYGRGFHIELGKKSFHNLRELHVSGTNFGNYGMDQLNKLPKLEVLQASQCGFAGASIQGLLGCDELKVLNLSGNTFFDDNMKIVSRLKNLEELRLAQISGLTDECLNSLKIMKTLKVLDLEGTRITEPAVKLLKEKFLKDTEILALGQKF